MGKLLKKILLLAVLTVAALGGYFGILTLAEPGTAPTASEVFYAIDKAAVPNDCTAVLLGDSVCNQLWDQHENIGGVCTLGCNQAITPCGTYLLLKAYLDAHPDTDTAYYLIRPQTLANDIWTNYSYQYFVLPFCTEENMALLEDETTALLYEKFGRLFVENKFVKTVLLNNLPLRDAYLSQVQTGDNAVTNRLSRTSVLYLRKMMALCQEKGVSLVVRPLPLADTEENHRWDAFREDILEQGLEELLGTFLEELAYYPEAWFSDGIHFTEEMLQAHQEELRAGAFETGGR